jgi:AraC-like DNA-binding protein
MDRSVERAISFIWERYSRPLSLNDIAESAALSRFYFARKFRHATGLTPGRFLAAVRVHEAKRMLLSTSTTITDIAFAVGYNSLGSFTNHFTESVGVSPGRFRHGSRNGGFELPRPGRNAHWAYGTIAGTISLPEGHRNARVYVGAFATPIVQHPSGAAVIVDVPGGQPCCYHLQDVPEGTWFIRAVGMADSTDASPWADRTTLVGRHDAVTVTANTATSAAVRLRPGRPTDPPVLLALPGLEPRPRLDHFAADAPCAAISSRQASG